MEGVDPGIVLHIYGRVTPSIGLVGQSIELAIGRAVTGYALAAEKLRRVLVGVVGLVILLLIITILMQNIG